MIGNLLPRIRPLSGHLSEDELLEAASYMAVYRVADEEASKASLPLDAHDAAHGDADGKEGNNPR